MFDFTQQMVVKEYTGLMLHPMFTYFHEWNFYSMKQVSMNEIQVYNVHLWEMLLRFMTDHSATIKKLIR